MASSMGGGMGGLFGGLFDEGGPMGAGAGFNSDEEHQGGGAKRPRAPQKVEVELKLRLEELYRWVGLAAGWLLAAARRRWLVLAGAWPDLAGAG
jgi:hypothetical protein